MKKIVLLIFASLFLAACGDRAPDDAVVTGPKDSTAKFPRQTTPLTVTFAPLDFVVRNGTDENAQLLGNIEMEFFAGGSARLSDFSGNLLATPFLVKNKTDDQGLGRVFATMTIPGCTGNTDSTVTGTVIATVGTASATWTGTATITCATTTTTP